MLEGISWLGHDSFLLVELGTGKRVLIDPYKLAKPVAADLILITHPHFDHYSPDDVRQCAGPTTHFVTVADVASSLQGRVTVIKPGDKVVVEGVPIETVPAYNTNKFRAPGQPFHPKSKGWVGFIVTLNGQRFYHTGDSDFVDEMRDLNVDIALLPVSGTYVMTPEEAAEAAKALRPRVAVPMHYGAIAGSEAEARRFAALCKQAGIETEILRPGIEPSNPKATS